jgi:hypothetical protein
MSVTLPLPLISITLQRLPLLDGQDAHFFEQLLDAVVDAVTQLKFQPEAPNEMQRARLVAVLETMRSTLTRLQSAYAADISICTCFVCHLHSCE